MHEGQITDRLDTCPRVSIIVPARDAARTLDRTLASIGAQTLADWEAIVIDNGSRDGTAAIARRYGDGDPRFRLITASEPGAAAARNAGLAAACGDWVQFLDADDALAPDHLARMLAAADAAPAADVLHCGWRRVVDGRPWRDVHSAVAFDDPVAAAAATCPFAIHAAITRRTTIERAGGFDPSLRIAEDWDLWQRLARTGARFVPVPAVVAEVSVEPASLSSDSERHLVDGLTVIARGHGDDPRVPGTPHAPPAACAAACWHFGMWVAASAIGRGRAGAALIEHVKSDPPAPLAIPALAAVIEDGLAIGAGADRPPWRHWQQFGPAVAELCHELASHAGRPEMGDQLLRAVEALVAATAPSGADALAGSVALIAIDPSKPIVDRDLKRADRLIVSIVSGDEVIGLAPVLAFGPLPAAEQWAMLRAHDNAAIRRALLQRRIADGPFALELPIGRGLREYARLLRSRRSPHVHRHASLPHEDVLALLYPAVPAKLPALADAPRLRELIAEQGLTSADAAPAPDDEGAAWVEPDYTQGEYWEEIFARVDPWDYRNDYEATKYLQTIDLVRSLKVGRALEIACAEGEFTRLLASVADEVLATDIAPTAVERARAALADLPNCSFARLDLLTEDPPGDFDLIVASEVLYYLSPEALAAFVDKVAAHLRPGGWFLTAHGNLLVDEPETTGFGWPHHFGAKGIGAHFARHPELTLEVEMTTPIYRIFRFRKGPADAPPQRIVADTARRLPERVAGQVKWRGGREAPVGDRWHDFPVLMYHRIVDDGPAALARYRTAPAAFEAQLAHLRGEGWHAISLERLRRALHEGQPLPERAVMLTFDDATTDFIDHALPLLHRYGFPATLFVPSGHVGGAAVWDADAGPPAPLLGWDDLRLLQFCDVAIGAHGVAHRPLTLIDADSVVRELAGGKAAIERELGAPVRSLAYPYGAFDDTVRDAARAVGFDFAFTCIDGRIGEHANPWVLFRREVWGGMPADRFADLIAGR